LMLYTELPQCWKVKQVANIRIRGVHRLAFADRQGIITFNRYLY
jgi:hypothetical protein